MLEKSVGGVYEVSENTEIYCYIVMIFKLFFGDNIGRISISEYFVYLEYLMKLGVSKELIDKLSYIYMNRSNENPYEYLEELLPYYGRTSKNVFNLVRKKMNL